MGSGLLTDELDNVILGTADEATPWVTPLSKNMTMGVISAPSLTKKDAELKAAMTLAIASLLVTALIFFFIRSVDG